jgi:cytochrome c oxidase subunit 1
MSVVLASLGGAAYIVIIVGSLLFGRRLDEHEKVGREMIAVPPPDSAYAGIGIGTITIPGTLVMVFVFFAAFVLYYFINWKYLAQTWGMS